MKDNAHLSLEFGISCLKDAAIRHRKFELAEECLGRLVMIKRESYGEMHDSLLVPILTLSGVQDAIHKVDLALENYQQGIDICEHLLSTDLTGEKQEAVVRLYCEFLDNVIHTYNS